MYYSDEQLTAINKGLCLTAHNIFNICLAWPATPATFGCFGNTIARLMHLHRMM